MVELVSGPPARAPRRRSYAVQRTRRPPDSAATGAYGLSGEEQGSLVERWGRGVGARWSGGVLVRRSCLPRGVLARRPRQELHSTQDALTLESVGSMSSLKPTSAPSAFSHMGDASRSTERRPLSLFEAGDGMSPGFRSKRSRGSNVRQLHILTLQPIVTLALSVTSRDSTTERGARSLARQPCHPLGSLALGFPS